MQVQTYAWTVLYGPDSPEQVNSLDEKQHERCTCGLLLCTLSLQSAAAPASVLLFPPQAPRLVPPVMRGARKRVARRGSMSHEAFQVMLAPHLMSDLIDEVSTLVVTPSETVLSCTARCVHQKGLK